MKRNGTVAVGFDGSDAGWTAMDYAATEAVVRGLSVRLVHALLEPAAYTETALIKPVENVPTEARRLLAFASSYLAQQYGDLGVRTVTGRGSAGELLVEESRTAELIVVGRRGRGHQPTAMGSVSAHVAAHSTCTVLVVSAPPRSPTGPVLLGVDVAWPSPSAIAFAFDTAERHGTDLTACYVWTPTPTVHIGPDRPYSVDSAHRMLAAALVPARAAYPEVAVSAAVVRNPDPAAGLLELADGASLVVVGPQGEAGVPRRAGGSVSDALLHHTSSPVVVTHATTTGVRAGVPSGA